MKYQFVTQPQSALMNDASADQSLYENRAGGPNVANNAPTAEMSLYASTVPAAVVYRLHQLLCMRQILTLTAKPVRTREEQVRELNLHERDIREYWRARNRAEVPAQPLLAAQGHRHVVGVA